MKLENLSLIVELDFQIQLHSLRLYIIVVNKQ